jgi:hypothetical protein
MTSASKRRQPGDGIVAGGRGELAAGSQLLPAPRGQLLDLRLSEDGSKCRRQAASGYSRPSRICVLTTIRYSNLNLIYSLKLVR